MKYIYTSRDKLLRRIFKGGMRRLVSSIIGLISLAFLVSVEIAVIGVILHGNIPLLVIALVTMLTAISMSFIWWLAKRITNRLLPAKINAPNQLVNKPL